VNSYLEKHRFSIRQINNSIVPDTSIIVVIPCYNEPDLLKTLQSLFDSEKTLSPVEVIVVINSGENDEEVIIHQNKKTFIDACEWIKNHPHEKLFFHLIRIENLPKKHAGVGLVRKIGMDEAAVRFDDISKDDGVIACLDADCTVDKKYLVEIEKHFQLHPKATGCSIYFEHPVDGNEFSKAIFQGIINYELFLRYYNRALHFCNFPYAFHTIGSSMAVRNKIYQKQGGMNRRKAGEDFYFLHKIFSLGNFTELNTVKVIPSPRESDRVPFGTGNAMQKLLAADSLNYFTYNIQTFIDLKDFFKKVPALSTSSPHYSITSSLSESIQKYLSQNNFEEKLNELKQNSASEKMFVKRFFNWFDGFMVLKFVHFARDNFYEQQEIYDAATSLLKLSEIKFPENISKKDLLLQYRKWENPSIK
jgi:glycosyltransferase involved in cell wall biosynthesis